jgi:hypothetical protein
MRGGIVLPLRAAAACAAAALSIAVAACGSSGAHSTSNAAAAPVATTPRNLDAIEQARVKAASCMRSQGINIPDIGVGGGQILQVLRIIATYPQTKVQAAMQACAPEIRQAFPNATSLSPAQRSQRRQEAIVFAQCMRAHGINFPEPTAEASNLAAYLDAVSALDLNSPAFKSAAVTCRGQALRAAGG